VKPYIELESCKLKRLILDFRDSIFEVNFRKEFLNDVEMRRMINLYENRKKKSIFEDIIKKLFFRSLFYLFKNALMIV
jgi:hypothetical protein